MKLTDNEIPFYKQLNTLTRQFLYYQAFVILQSICVHEARAGV